MSLRAKVGLMVLQWTLGLVILIEAILFVMPGARPGFASTHMPDVLRLLLGWGEIVGAILLLIPRTTLYGARLLMAIFVLAIAVHLLHGMHNVGNLLIYTAAALAIAASK
jgi:uncharacterized membrane protein YphA (DoxX/SURF4 family)